MVIRTDRVVSAPIHANYIGLEVFSIVELSFLAMK